MRTRNRFFSPWVLIGWLEYDSTSLDGSFKWAQGFHYYRVRPYFHSLAANVPQIWISLIMTLCSKLVWLSVKLCSKQFVTISNSTEIFFHSFLFYIKQAGRHFNYFLWWIAIFNNILYIIINWRKLLSFVIFNIIQKLFNSQSPLHFFQQPSTLSLLFHLQSNLPTPPSTI